MSADPFVGQLAGLCRSERTVAKWVIVPAHAVGRTLGERLAREGVDWVNLRFVTPFALALQAAAPHLLAQGLDPLPDGLGPALAMRLLMELPPEIPSYFRPLAEQPRMGEALWATVRELRLAGITSAALDDRLKSGATTIAVFEDERKRAELCALLAAYEEHLARHRQADAADVYRAAARRPVDSPVAAWDVVVALPSSAPPPPLVRAFLDALPGRRIACATPRVPGIPTPRRLAGAERDVRPALSRLAFLLAPGEAPAPAKDEHIELFHAAGREAEVEAVLRRILAASPGVALDAVEIACAAPDAAPLLWEKARRLGLPVTIEDGVPITATRPARALLGLCDWIDSTFTATRLRRLLQSGDWHIEFPDGAGSGRAARLLAKSGASWGRRRTTARSPRSPPTTAPARKTTRSSTRRSGTSGSRRRSSRSSCAPGFAAFSRRFPRRGPTAAWCWRSWRRTSPA